MKLINTETVKLILTLVFFTSYSAQSQIIISGPLCVKPGSEYHYTIESNNKESSAFQVCVHGGIIKDVRDTCASQFSSSVIKIIWNNVASGSLRVNSNTNARSLLVGITSDLEPGKINTASLAQLIEQGTTPKPLQCSEAREGNCFPSYEYLWQQSQDKIIWYDINNGTDRDLKLAAVINEPTYYRRKVTETNSGTIKYSDIASVYVNPKSN